MAFIIKDRVKEGTTSTGTGAITLSGSLATFDTFQSYMTNGDTTYYAIVHTSSGVDEWEVGLGTWNTGNTLTRTTVLAGSNGTSAEDFSAGSKDVFMTYPAAHAALAGDDVDFANITVTGTVDGRDVATDGSKLDTVEQNADVTDAINVAAAGALMKSGGTMTGNLILNGDPTVALGAATKEYVDTIAAAGIHYHTPVRVEAPLNLTVTYNNGASGVGATLTNAGTQEAITIDGVALSSGDRVLVYEQTDATQNGIYTVTTVGSGSTNWVLTRATDADSYGASDPDAFGEGDAFFVKEGATGAGELYVMNTSGTITFGTTDITFTVIAETAVYSAGTGLSLTGTTFAIGQDVGTTANVTFNQVTAAIIGNVTGDVTGNVTGNAGTATKLATARSIALSGDVTGNANFDGTGNISITAVVQDDSHSHIISNVDGLQTALDGKTTTARTITAGDGLTGGGDLTANRTLNVGAGTGVTVNADTVSIGQDVGTTANVTFNDIRADGGNLILGDDAYSTSTDYVGMKTSYQSGSNDYMIISGTADGATYVSAKSNQPVYIRGGGNQTAYEIVVRTNAYATSAGSTIITEAGSGLSKSSRTLSHADTSTQASVNNSDGTVIQDITLDTYGHITGIASTNLDGRYYTETEADSRFVNVTGDTMTGTLTLSSSGYADQLTVNRSDGDYYSVIKYANSTGELARMGFTNTGVLHYRVGASGTLVNIFHDNYHPNADKWTTARTLSLSGDASGSVSWDGSANASLSVTVANDSHTHDGRYYTESEADSRFLRSDISDVYAGRVLEFGNAGNGQNTNGAFLTIEGNTDSSGEGSGRIMFREHNSTTSAADAYGMSLGYRGGGTSVTTAMGNSWTGLSQIGNGEWGMWGHDANATGALIAHGPRSGAYTDFTGLKVGGNNVFHDGYHPNADKWTTARTLSLSGDASGSVSWDGSGNATLSVAVADDSHNHNHSDGDFTVNGGNLYTGTSTQRVKLSVWSDTTYGIGMKSGYTFGGLNNNYAMSFQMNSDNARGFWWGDSTHTDAQGAMALTTDGVLNVANNIAVGYGESDTTRRTTYNLDVNGTAGVSTNLTLGNNLLVGSNKGIVSSGAWTRVSTTSGYIEFGPANTTWAHIYTDRPNFYFNKELYVNNSKVWNAGNDGSGSGLDADLLDGVQGNKYFTSYNNAGTTGWEDSNRNFRINSGGTAVGFAMHESDGTFGFNVYGDGSHYGFLDANWGNWDIQKQINGAFKVDEGSGLQRVFNDAYHPNADKWTTARTLSLSGDASGSVSWDGSANATLSVTVADDSHSHSQVFIPDTRGAARAPSYYPDRYVSFDFQNNADTGAGGDSWHVLQTVSPWSTYNDTHRQQQIAFTGSGGIKFRYATSDSAWAGWQTIWTSGNDGSGSNLDADLLDGEHGSYYYPASNPNGYTTNTGTIVENGTVFSGTYPVYFRIGANNAYSHTSITFTGSTATLNVPNIAVSGTVDGRNVSVDGTKLDGIAANANNYSLPATPSVTGINIGSQVNLAESSDRADLLQITSSTSSWAGLQIRNSSNEGRWSFMTDGAEAGFYDDENSEWAVLMAENGAVKLYHNNVLRLGTLSDGVDVSGTLYVDDKIVHNGDTDTYTEFHAADQWRVVCGGTERLEVNSSDIWVAANIQMNSHYLDMNNNDIYGVDQIFHEADTDTYMQFHAADQWRVVTGGAERLEVNNSQITSTEPIHAPSFHGDGSALTGLNISTPLTGLPTGTDATGSDLIPVYDVSAGTWEKQTITNAALQGPAGVNATPTGGESVAYGVPESTDTTPETAGQIYIRNAADTGRITSGLWVYHSQTTPSYIRMAYSGTGEAANLRKDSLIRLGQSNGQISYVYSQEHWATFNITGYTDYGTYIEFTVGAPFAYAGGYFSNVGAQLIWTSGTNSWTSSTIAWAKDTTYSLTHNLGVAPKTFSVEYVCVSPIYGYAVGDTLFNMGERYSNWGQIVLQPTSTTVKLAMLDSGILIRRQDSQSTTSQTLSTYFHVRLNLFI